MRRRSLPRNCYRGQHNVIVDPATLKIKAIIDWEFGGF
jgi:hypothetical protein